MRRFIAPLVTSLTLLSGCQTVDRMMIPEPSSPTRVSQTRTSHAVAEEASLAEQPTLADQPTADHAPMASPADVGLEVQPVKYEAPPESEQLTPNDQTVGQDMLAQNVQLVTLDGLESTALVNNPALAQAAARVRAARGTWIQTGLPPNPQLSYVGSEIGNEGTSGQQGGTLGQQFITGKKLRLNRQIAAWEVERARQELESVRYRVLTDVRIAYYDVLVAQDRKKLTRSLVNISQQAVASAQALFKGGEVSEADPLRTRVEAQRAEILAEQADTQYAEAWRRLAAVVGVPDMAPQDVVGDLDPAEIELSWDETLQQLLSESPEISAALADVEAARWAVRRARAQVIPNVSVQASVQTDNSSGDTLTGVQVTLPIPIINRNQGGIMRARAQATVAQQAVDRLALELQQRLAVAFQRYAIAKERVTRYTRKDGIIDSAKQTLDLVRAGYDAEEFSVLDLLTAQRSYFEAQLAYLQSLNQLWRSAMEIRGLLLRGSLSSNQ